MKQKLPKKFLAQLNAVTAKRPRTVIQYILEHGYVTTEDLKNLGYEHAPRAARDVREQGIPLETFRVKDSTGRSIAAYRFGDPKKAGDKLSKAAGRTVLSAALKKALIEKYGSKCFIYRQRTAPSHGHVNTVPTGSARTLTSAFIVSGLIQRTILI